MDFLEKIVRQKIIEIKERKTLIPFKDLEKSLSKTKKTSDFKKALSISKSNKINLIAEIKHASPSKGIIREQFDHKEIAKIYDLSNVSAISVLTEKNYFKGNLKYLKDIHEITSTPLLMKDFIIDEYQIYEAKIYNSSAILLITAILDRKQLQKFLNLAKEIDLNCLVEIHNKEELKKVLDTDAEIIGINNRNLKTFEVDIHTSLKLKEQIPQDKILVSESGIKTKEDILELKSSGFNAVLIGETFMKSQDIALEIKNLGF